MVLFAVKWGKILHHQTSAKFFRYHAFKLDVIQNHYWLRNGKACLANYLLHRSHYLVPGVFVIIRPARTPLFFSSRRKTLILLVYTCR